MAAILGVACVPIRESIECAEEKVHAMHWCGLLYHVHCAMNGADEAHQLSKLGSRTKGERKANERGYLQQLY